MDSCIIKFGGSSVGTPERIAHVISLFSHSSDYRTGCVHGVVVSAFQGVTDQLISIAQLAAARSPHCQAELEQLEERHLNAVTALIPAKYRSATLANVKVLLNELADVIQGVSLVGECTDRTLDLVVSFGERLSATIVCEAANASQIPCHYLDARKLIVTNDTFSKAVVQLDESYSRIRDYFSGNDSLPIITGFIAATNTGATTTLGRGGSDYTAALFGAALGVDEIHIWTDVDGMLTADPRKVPKAFPIPEVSVEEAMELCHFGAKVIYPPTIQPAVDAGVPILIKNTFRPQAPGTRIARETRGHAHPITGITSISNIALLRIQGSGMVGVAGVAMRFFKALALHKINIILITQASSEHTICCAIEPRSVDAAKAAVHEEFGLEIQARMIAPLVAEEHLAIVSVVGEKMRSTPGISGRVFSALGANGINVVAIAQGSSELNISAVIPSREETKALSALHDEFFVDTTKTIHLWMIGTGLIGKTLLSQMQDQLSVLRERHGLEFNLRGLANSRHMHLADETVLHSLPFEALSDSSVNFDCDTFFNHSSLSSKPNKVFIDCSASDKVPRYYRRLLEQSISIVTPNKKGLAGDIQLYRELKESARRRRTLFLHETSVGAGLPVLSTLADLVRSGDSLLKIEAVLSGTLSYIFNSMAGGKAFSVAVRSAMELGLTEPDPRDDLSGMDVARKVLILAREGGVPLTLEQVEVTPLLPVQCAEWTRDEFIGRLDELDSHFQELCSDTSSHIVRPFFAAEIDFTRGTAKIGLVLLGSEHPFSALSGSDNMISFTTHRYLHQPLVVKGPGAGAEVTAAGVFADVIRIAH